MRVLTAHFPVCKQDALNTIPWLILLISSEGPSSTKLTSHLAALHVHLSLLNICFSESYQAVLSQYLYYSDFSENIKNLSVCVIICTPPEVSAAFHLMVEKCQRGCRVLIQDRSRRISHLLVDMSELFQGRCKLYIRRDGKKIRVNIFWESVTSLLMRMKLSICSIVLSQKVFVCFQCMYVVNTSITSASDGCPLNDAKADFELKSTLLLNLVGC